MELINQSWIVIHSQDLEGHQKKKHFIISSFKQRFSFLVGYIPENWAVTKTCRMTVTETANICLYDTLGNETVFDLS